MIRAGAREIVRNLRGISMPSAGVEGRAGTGPRGAREWGRAGRERPGGSAGGADARADLSASRNSRRVARIARPKREEADQMACKSLRLAVLAAFGFVLLAQPAQAQRPVDFEEETHFRCYTISNQTPEPATTVSLDDQFLEATLSVDEPELFCPPTSKDGLEIEEPEGHLTTYNAPWPLEPDLSVSTEDQFGPRTLTVIGARELYVPTEKNELGFPDELNHYWCYEASGPRVRQRVTLDDQLGTHTVRVER